MINDSDHTAAVVGVGVKCPGGADSDSLWRSLLAGRACAEPLEEGLAPPQVMALKCAASEFEPARYFPPHELRRLDRIHQLGIAAARDAMAKCEDIDPTRFGLVVGIGHGAIGFLERQFLNLVEHGPNRVTPLAIPVGMPNSVAAHISLAVGARGPTHTICVACASGTAAIGEALWLLRTRRADRVLAGGADALITYGSLSFFWRTDALSRNVGDPAHASRPFDKERDGFVLGEGAAFLVLERAHDAHARGADVLGYVLGYGESSDAHHLVVPEPDGIGAHRAMTLALRDAEVSPSDVAQVNAHGTSTRLNDVVESRVIDSIFGSAAPLVTSTKGTTGHLIGASGAVEAVVSLRSAAELCVPPTAGTVTIDPDVSADVVIGSPRVSRRGFVLSNSFGFGGHNASVVLSGPELP